MGTGYVTQVLVIVLAAAGNGVGRAVALKQAGGGRDNYIAGRLGDCQIGVLVATENSCGRQCSLSTHQPRLVFNMKTSACHPSVYDS